MISKILEFKSGSISRIQIERCKIYLSDADENQTLISADMHEYNKYWQLADNAIQAAAKNDGLCNRELFTFNNLDHVTISNYQSDRSPTLANFYNLRDDDTGYDGFSIIIANPGHHKVGDIVG